MIEEKEQTAKGLDISYNFSKQGIAPYDEINWNKRTAAIKGDTGAAVFEQHDCEFPESWSQLAVNVVASKYFYGEPGTAERETSLKQLIDRVADTISEWGYKDGYFDKDNSKAFNSELKWLLVNQYGAFNSPVWFNVGLWEKYGVTGAKCTWHWDEEKGEAVQPENSYEFPQGSACFIQSVDDTMDSIMELAASEAMLFKFGSGTGTNLSSLRSTREKLSGGGKPSGPLSFMRIYDQIAGVVKSGGKTRRAAKMQILDVSHPDIMEFIDCKMKEEEKAKILMKNGYSYEDAYSSVMYQNANLSVRLTDDFMNAVKEDKPWTTKWVTDPNKDGPTYQAREILNKIAQRTWECGDPGVQFDTTINEWNTVPNTGRINSSNPCFTGDMRLLTVDGYKTFKELAGTEPRIFNHKRNATTGKVWYSGKKTIINLVCAEPEDLNSDKTNLIKCTPDHKFMTFDGRVIAAKDAAGEYLLSWWALNHHNDSTLELKNAIKVLKVENNDETADVYDFTEPETHWGIVEGVVASNCSEYMSVDNTACNLASINLMKFVTRDKDSKLNGFDYKRFIAACRIFFIAQEILVDRASYPIKKIAENSHKLRAIGLGYSNLGSLLMRFGIPYESNHAYSVCHSITSTLLCATYLVSSELAKLKGPFEEYAKNKNEMLAIVDRHAELATQLLPKEELTLLLPLWQQLQKESRATGFRNCATTVLAPTGTISFMMDCDTTGIEPELALIKYKQLAGGGTFKLVNTGVEDALLSLGYTQTERAQILEYIEKNETIAGAPGITNREYSVFNCAFPDPANGRCITPLGHIEMMSAAQNFISMAISKTINVDNTITADDIAKVYMYCWEKGLKGVAIYRDGSKGMQPLTVKETKIEEKPKELTKKEKRKIGPKRERMPDTRNAITHKFNISGHEGYITAGMYPDGRVGEMFVTMAKEGSTIGGLMDCLGTSVSIGLQYGVPMYAYMEKFVHTRFEPLGYTKNPDIPNAKSLADYIFRWIDKQFLQEPKEQPKLEAPAEVSADDQQEQFKSFQSDAPICDVCGSITVRAGSCYLCHSCGKSLGCS